MWTTLSGIVAALTLALTEMKKFGKSYAEQVIRNAQALASALAEAGFPAVCPHLEYTRSHQVFREYGGYKEDTLWRDNWRKANIIVDCGVSVSVCEVTRRGMKEKRDAESG